MTSRKMISRRNTFCKSILLLISLGMIAALVACSSSSPTITTTPPPAISVSISSPLQNLAVNGMAGISATVLNDSANAGVNWTVTCGSAACGSFNPTSTLSGVNTTYTAPAAIPTGGTVTLIATSVTDPTKSANITVNITLAAAITVTITTPSPYLAVSAFTGITPTTNDSAGVNWTVTCGSTGACGSFNPTSTLTGVSTTYQAPAAIPTGSSVTVTATSVTDPTKSASGNIVITNLATLAAGTYVYSLSGQNANGLYSVSGAFTVASGQVITGGEQDFIDVDPNTVLARPLNDTIQATGSSLTSLPDGNLEITLNTGDPIVGVSGVETLQATLVSSSKALIIEFDSATSSGTLDLQTSTPATPSGGYAFYVSGEDPAGPAITAIGGVINVDSPGGISGTGSVFDLNDFFLPSVYTDQLFAASIVTSPSPGGFGRVEFILNTDSSDSINTGAGSPLQINLIGYVVDAGHIRLVETGDTYGGVTGGSALGQTGTFTNASISGSSYVIGTTGTDDTFAFQVAGVLTLTATSGSSTAGTVSGTLNYNDLAVQNGQGGTPFSGTYTLDTVNAGRITLSNLTDSAGDFSYNLQLYLTGDGHATVISVDANDVVAGLGFQQQTGSFTASSFSGSYAFGFGQIASSGDELDGVGALTADGVSSLAGFANINAFLNGGIASLDNPVSGTFAANANGIFTGSITGIDSTSAATADSFTYYLVDGTQAVAIETDTNQLTLGYVVLQQ
jgi:hypothetical protein